MHRFGAGNRSVSKLALTICVALLVRFLPSIRPKRSIRSKPFVLALVFLFSSWYQIWNDDELRCYALMLWFQNYISLSQLSLRDLFRSISWFSSFHLYHMELHMETAIRWSLQCSPCSISRTKADFGASLLFVAVCSVCKSPLIFDFICVPFSYVFFLLLSLIRFWWSGVFSPLRCGELHQSR